MGRKLALIVGNSQYDDAGLARLSAPDADVLALADVLRDGSIGAFDGVEAVVNENFARTRRAIARFFDERKRDDLLLLYFSGHGIRDEYGRLHLAVRDTERELLAATAIEAAFITECMDRSASKRLVLMLDCCHSGAFGYGAKSAQGASVGTAVAFEGTGRGRIVLTATDATQYAWEGDTIVGDAQPSVFTRHLTAGLRTGAADLDGDGIITVDELYDYVYEQVLNDTVKQTPGKWAFGQQGDIVIARNPAVAGAVAATGAGHRPRTGARRSTRGADEDEIAPPADSAVERFKQLVLPRLRQPATIVALLAVAALLAVLIQQRPAPNPGEREPIVQNAPVTAPAADAPDPRPVSAPARPAGDAAGTTAPVAASPAPPPASSPATRPPVASLAGNRGVRQPTVRDLGPAPPADATRRGDSTPAPQPEATAVTNTREPPVVERRNETAGADPPPARPVPVPVSAEAQIQAALQHYERARSNMDLDALKDIWPTMQLAVLRRAYADISSESVQLTRCTSPTTDGATASIQCSEQVRAKFRTGGSNSHTSRATFLLRRDNDRWLIARITRAASKQD